jgi:short-subunit dehydrogenase
MVLLPKRFVYVSFKSYITTFAELLHQELEGTGYKCRRSVPNRWTLPSFTVRALTCRGSPTAPLEPEDVVATSLSGLHLGEVNCVPALDDPILVAQVRESERQLLARCKGAALSSDTPTS